MFESLSRYWQVWRAALAEDKARPKVDRKRDELEFLPAALEVLETPVSPTGRIVTWSIVALFVAAIAWGWFGWIDTEAVAQGKIIPGGQVKVIQPLEIGTVRAIHVKEGQRVKAGELLVELDPTDSDANQERLEADLLAARLDVARIETLLARAMGKPDTPFVPPAGVSAALETASRALLLDSLGEHRAQLATLNSQIAQRRASYGVIKAGIARLEGVVPLLAERVSAKESLVAKKVSSRMTFLELKQELVEAEGSIAVERYRLQEVEAELASLEQQRAERIAAFQAEQQAALAEALQQQAALEQELRKARERNRLRQLRAPVDGIVQQLQVHTVGGVVQAAQPVMVVVPEGTPLEIEAMVLNKDIGFVEAGQVVEIKVESFPYTKYGLIEGRVEQVSADAIEDEKLGLVYKARASMERDKILVGDRWVPLTPGMAVTLEVKTGKRRAIEFFLAPFLRYQDEAMRER